MKDRFYLACFRDNVGSNVGFHAIDGLGYTTDITKAHVYNKEQAQRAWENAREYDQPISADHIDELAVYKVDCQYIPCETTITDEEYYAAYAKKMWDGNDVYFQSVEGLTTDFSKALKITKHDALLFFADKILIPYSIAENVKRKTFQFSNINKRKMIQGAGLVTPDRIKKYKRRVANPKERWNCPCCGKINWQYNPYDFEGCNDVNCKEHPLNRDQTWSY